ncbi:hypothetical protein FOA52_005046 [Chlamydomonas sp. UWO 241]|nr:hypothetical protein FOA52_005046 [Chlamydomonas sp. UWO 241]
MPATPRTLSQQREKQLQTLKRGKHTQHRSGRVWEERLGDKVEGALTKTNLRDHGISSVAEWNTKATARRAARTTLNALLVDPSVPGVDKMAAKAAYNMTWSKTLFNCQGCWLLPGFCVCNRLARVRAETRVVVHVHHIEWGKASNTGCVIRQTLEGSEILMKGCREHDARIAELFADDSVTTAVLWPGENALSGAQLKAVAAERTGGRIAVIAVDATWRNARGVAGAYPEGAITVKLSPDSPIISSTTQSLLYPVRKYRGDMRASARVSTLEAVAALLVELEGGDDQAGALIANVKIKVDAVLAQKNRPAAYDLGASSSGDEDTCPRPERVRTAEPAEAATAAVDVTTTA